MKIAVFAVLILALAGALYFSTLQSKQPLAASTPDLNIPIWEQPLPANVKLVDGRTAKIHVVPVRQNVGPQNWLEFHITEEHGYMVDGIQLQFWYRFKDPESGQWVEDPKPVKYYVKERLGLNETLVSKTVLLSLEFEHLGIDIASTTDENWQVEVVRYARAMEPA